MARLCMHCNMDTLGFESHMLFDCPAMRGCLGAVLHTYSLQTAPCCILCATLTLVQWLAAHLHASELNVLEYHRAVETQP